MRSHATASARMRSHFLECARMRSHAFDAKTKTKTKTKIKTRESVLRTRTHDLLLPADTGIASRLHFERQAFWHAQRCIHWVPAAQAALPRRLCQGVWILRHHTPGYMRLARDELEVVIGQWPLEGPQTWDERKDELIERMRPCAALRRVPVPSGTR